MPELGGLKGEKAPGDAHPYLALFWWFCFLTKPHKNDIILLSFPSTLGENINRARRSLFCLLPN